VNAGDNPVASALGHGKMHSYPAHEYCDFLIIDEMLPCDFSPFRSLEYSHYLSHFDSSLLVSTEGWHGAFSNLSFEDQLAESSLPEAVKRKIRPFSQFPAIVPKLAYITFLHNAWQMFPFLVDRQIPFVLQLYPGGRFEIGNEESDNHLQTVVKSPLCRKVIVTQNLSRDYLLDHIGCDPEKVQFIYGGVYDTNNGFDFLRDKKFYGKNKNTLDVCFVAHRYDDDTRKKGYDQFVAVAKVLVERFPDLRFHVVGDYTSDQIPLEGAAGKFIFHGKRPTSFFREFYPSMDIILSANRPSSDGAGAFDGFPTGACMEAGFWGVLNCISDPLKMNVAFTDEVDVVFVDFDATRTAEKLAMLLEDTARLYSLAYENWRKFTQVFDSNRQMWDRCRLITEQLLKTEALIIRPAPRLSVMDISVLSGYMEELRQLTANYKEAETRHDNLLAEYRQLASGFLSLQTENARLVADHASIQKEAETRHDNLLAEYRQLASGFLSLQAENARLVADNASLSTTVATAPVLGRAELLILSFTRSRPAMFLRRSVSWIKRRVGKST